MSDNTARLGLPELVQMQEMDSAQINDVLQQLDALGGMSLKGLFTDTPPAAPMDGDTYVTGGAPAGVWAGNLYKIAYCVDGGWRIFTPFDGLVAHVAATDSFVVYRGGQWAALGALVAGPGASIASAATCDLGAAGALNLLITGAATITSFGGGANLLRFVRFAGPLTLTHNATSLILPGGADIDTAAGDFAGLQSDAGGNWRCVFYSRADGRMVNMASPAFTGSPTFSAGGHEVGRVGADGSLLWGTTTNGGWSGYARVEGATNGSLQFGVSGYAVSGYSNAFGGRIDSTNSNLAGWYYRTAGVGSITSIGTSVAYNTSSDARLKKDIQDAGDSGSIIDALKVRSWVWKTTGASEAFGFVAQEEYEAAPFAVTPGDGDPDTITKQWQRDDSKLVPLLVKEIQNMRARLAALEARA